MQQKQKQLIFTALEKTSMWPPGLLPTLILPTQSSFGLTKNLIFHMHLEHAKKEKSVDIIHK